MSPLSITLATAFLASLALARTDLTGCTSTDISSPAGASVAWYVPGTGELCDFLDCGGGRAPPKTDVPGCAAYSGTATYSPSYLPGYGSMTVSTAVQTATGTISSDDPSANNPTVITISSATGGALTNSAAQISTMSTSSGALESTTMQVSTMSTTSGALESSAVQTSMVSTTRSATSSSAAAGADAPSASPSAYTGAGAAMKVANVWVSGAGLIGLGALVVVM